MASRVKVNISKEKLLKVLNERITELESGEAPKMSTAGENLLAYLNKCIEAIKNDDNLPRGRDEWHVYEYRNYNDRYGNKKSDTPETMIAKIRKQIKLIELSDDTIFSVGINDELYELL